MFQFEASSPRHRPTRVARQADATPVLSHRAFLAWGEHCQECALPECFQTCDLYDATPAGKCRRFVDGIVRNSSGDGLPGGEIRFRKWAKLEAQGNAAMLPANQVDRYERLFARFSAPVAHAGRLLHRLGAAPRWMLAEETLCKRINQRLQARPLARLPEVFVAEISNLTGRAVTLILTAYVDKARMSRAVRSDQLPPPTTIRLELPPGLSHHDHAVDAMQPLFLSGLPFNFSLMLEGEDVAHLVFHRLDFGIRAAAVSATAGPETGKAPAPAAKLVIFDLDNTLWRGVLLEGEVTPVAGLAEMFRTLDERGILISVASKNAPEDAMAKLAELGLDTYLLYPQIGWLPKSEGVSRIIRAINIGADTVIFVDDNPFERAEVASAIAGVEVLPETALADLTSHPRLAGSATAEARGRRAMYQQAIAREEAAAAFGDDYLRFLESCAITVAIRPDRPEDLDRVSELLQRTNQLNFSGRKYARPEITEILASPERERYCVEVTDKFGSYGIVGFCLCRREAMPDGPDDRLVIEDFMLSCRVQGKFVEQALFHALAENGPAPVRAIAVTFRKTERNKAAQMVLEKLGFETGADGEDYRRDYRSDDLAVPFMTVHFAQSAVPA